MSENTGIQSIARAFKVIEAMTVTPQNSVTQLSRDTGLNKTTVFRILDTLLSLGYVSKNASTEKYSLTLKFLKISAKQLADYDITKKVRPLLKKICATADETVHLVERSGENVVYIDKCEATTNSVRMVSRIGSTQEVFNTAVGKAILAHLTDEEICELWNDHPHIKKTQNTIIDLEKFLREISQIRQQGYAVDDEENELDVRCVAVAFEDLYNEYRYAISISAPKSRTDYETLEKRAELLKRVISEEL